jgi:cytochrome c oxidase assembly protein subunit 15
MTLGDFKRIFFWEYVHRLLGRVIGVAVFVPWLYFLIRRRFDRHLALHTFGLFVAGGMQGVLGWWMVKSGLVDEPSVSHLRLAAHLGLALFLACWTLWLWLGERRRAAGVAPVRGTPLRRFGAAALLGMVSLQMIYGAFMAGTHAGLLFSTFPDMNSEWVPSGIGALTPFLWDLVENPVTIHFVHRTLGWVVFFAVFVALVFGRDADDAPERARRRWLVGALTLVQFSLGVATVMTGVSLPLAVSHQLGGVLLLSACVAYVESHFARVRHTTT